MKMRRLILISFLLIIALLTSCIHSNEISKVAPDEIMGMKKFVVLEGEEAIKRAQASHGYKLKYIEDAVVVHYTDGKHMVILWITKYPNSKIAEEENRKMAEKIKESNMSISLIKINGEDVYNFSISKTHHHYFWSKREYLLYLIPYNIDDYKVLSSVVK